MVERDAPRYVPPGWPPEVNPPGIRDWEMTAAAWLLDLVPEYRQHAAVRRHPVILAFIARHVIAGAVEGARQGYRVTRSELGDLVPPHAIDAALRAWYAHITLSMLALAWLAASKAQAEKGGPVPAIPA
jgi:hypothetical protein